MGHTRPLTLPNSKPFFMFEEWLFCAITIVLSLYVDYETVPDNFVQYYDRCGESFLLFYAGDTINDKRHYMDNEELSFEETVDEMLETWKDVMRKLYNLFGKLNVHVREMSAEELEDRTEGPSDSMTE